MSLLSNIDIGNVRSIWELLVRRAVVEASMRMGLSVSVVGRTLAMVQVRIVCMWSVCERNIEIRRFLSGLGWGLSFKLLLLLQERLSHGFITLVDLIVFRLEDSVVLYTRVHVQLDVVLLSDFMGVQSYRETLNDQVLGKFENDVLTHLE